MWQRERELTSLMQVKMTTATDIYEFTVISFIKFSNLKPTGTNHSVHLRALKSAMKDCHAVDKRWQENVLRQMSVTENFAITKECLFSTHLMLGRKKKHAKRWKLHYEQLSTLHKSCLMNQIKNLILYFNVNGINLHLGQFPLLARFRRSFSRVVTG